MAINFNSLPTSKPSMGTIIPKGNYKATIVKAEMKEPKDPQKPDYFSAECNITDTISGSEMGKFWINLYDSPAALCKFQIGQFIRALQLNISGEFELSDLTKIVRGKELMVDICPEERKDGKEAQRSVVDISADCFYPVGVQTQPTANDAIAATAEEVLGGAPIPEQQQAPVVASNY